MSEPATFAIIRDGQRRYYGDRWASTSFIRELVWGPEALETWVMTLTELDDWESDFVSAVVVDFDQRKFTWLNIDDRLEIPKVAAAYNRLLSTAWPGYVVERALTDDQLNAALGVKLDPSEDHYSASSVLFADRSETVTQAASEETYDDEDDDEDDEGNGEVLKLSGPESLESPDESSDADAPEAYEFEETEHRAWVTITDRSGAIRHRQLRHLSKDLLLGDTESFQRLSELEPCEVPPEEVVTEGMWFEEAERTIGFWGGPAVEALMPAIEKGWAGWDVQWASRGYAQHCAATGPTGKPLSVEQALAKLLPMILSTERFSLANFVGAIGGSLKKTAIKGTGCLLIVICSPLLIFGAVSGNWTAVLITVAIVLLLTIIAFKVIENKIKRGFKNKLSNSALSETETGPATAGPLDPKERRRSLDKLLAAAGFPSLSKVEPLFPPKSELGLD